MVRPAAAPPPQVELQLASCLQSIEPVGERNTVQEASASFAFFLTTRFCGSTGRERLD
jgi:hypothetical protein